MQERSRTLAFYLDAVGVHSSIDAFCLLNERLRGLLHLDEDLVKAARDLYCRAAAAGPEWQALADVLLAFGAVAGQFSERLETRRWNAELPA